MRSMASVTRSHFGCWVFCISFCYFREPDQTDFKEVYLPAAVSHDVLAENTRTLEEQMASLRLVGLGPVMVIIRKKERY